MTVIAKFMKAVTNGLRNIQVNNFGKYNPRTMSECSPWGVDANPVSGTAAVFSDTVSITQPGVVLGYIQKNQLAQPGESRFFSTNSAGVEQARIWLHDNGDIELGGTGAAGSNTNHAVQFEALETALDDYLNTPVTGLIAQIKASFTALGGAFPVTGVLPTLDITPAKLTKIKTE